MDRLLTIRASAPTCSALQAALTGRIVRLEGAMHDSESWRGELADLSVWGVRRADLKVGFSSRLSRRFGSEMGLSGEMRALSGEMRRPSQVKCGPSQVKWGGPLR